VACLLFWRPTDAQHYLHRRASRRCSCSAELFRPEEIGPAISLMPLLMAECDCLVGEQAEGRPVRLLRPRPVLKKSQCTNAYAPTILAGLLEVFGSAASLGPTTYLRNVPSGTSTGVGGYPLITGIKTCVTTRTIAKPGRQNIRQRPARTLRMRSLRTRRETRRPSVAVG